MIPHAQNKAIFIALSLAALQDKIAAAEEGINGLTEAENRFMLTYWKAVETDLTKALEILKPTAMRIYPPMPNHISHEQ